MKYELTEKEYIKKGKGNLSLDYASTRVVDSKELENTKNIIKLHGLKVDIEEIEDKIKFSYLKNKNCKVVLEYKLAQ